MQIGIWVPIKQSPAGGRYVKKCELYTVLPKMPMERKIWMATFSSQYQQTIQHW